jgi:hypothetical protein
MRVAVGSPDNAILKAASGLWSPLTVTGTNFVPGATVFMGSTTLSVLQKTPVPALAIPSGLGDPARICRHGPVVASLQRSNWIGNREQESRRPHASRNGSERRCCSFT